MAKKLDVDIDPGKFLDSFRPEMPASAPEVEDKAEGNAGGNPQQRGQRLHRRPQGAEKERKRNIWNAS